MVGIHGESPFQILQSITRCMDLLKLKRILYLSRIFQNNPRSILGKMSRTRRNTTHASSLRYPKTQSEKRLVASSLEQGVPVRAKRNPKNLPDSYDDLIVSAKSEEISHKVVDKTQMMV